jgi:16S rRNA (guanine966-N2)-methyltransferase
VRIVAGEWRGRRLAVPPGAVRPTADRVREAWMSIVHTLLPGAAVLDLCAGSGALGLEALSRGARHATFVESNARVLRTLRENIELVGAEGRSTVVGTDAARYIARLEADSFDVAFADPPYESGLAAAVAARWLAVPFAHVIGIEHSARETLPGGGDMRRYGDTAITFFRVVTPDSAPADPSA